MANLGETIYASQCHNVSCEAKYKPVHKQRCSSDCQRVNRFGEQLVNKCFAKIDCFALGS